MSNFESPWTVTLQAPLSLHWQAGSLPLAPPGKPFKRTVFRNKPWNIDQVEDRDKTEASRILRMSDQASMGKTIVLCVSEAKG